MATIEDLKIVLDSIDSSMTQQVGLLTSMLSGQERQAQILRADRSTATTPTASRAIQRTEGLGTQAGNLAGGVGNLLGGLGKGVGFAGAGIGAALFGLSSVIDKLPNGQDIKDNVETLLSIGEGYESRLAFFVDGGALALMLGGLGAGLAAFAVGTAAAAGTQTVIEKFEAEDWPETVKTNVESLLSIGDGLTLGNLQLLAEGGAIAAALTGLGLGLAAFSAGEGVAAAVDYFSGDSDWAEKVKSNVDTLLSITDNKTLGALELLFEGAGVSAALIGLSAGLIAFSAGQGVSEAVDYFSKENWAQNVKDSVETLLSISDLDGVGWDTVGFIGVMGGIATGLAAFSLGKGAEGVIQGYQDALKYFTGEQDKFADRIYNQVEKLLSIPQMPGVGVDTAAFVATMGGITLGLAAFALGKGVEGLTEGGQQALSYFTGEDDFADRIYNQVARLMEVTDLVDGDGEGSKANQFALGLAKISAGLIAFTGADFVGQLAGVGQEILSFFGAQSPFEKIIDIAEQSENLERGANAIRTIADALSEFANIRTGAMDVDFEEFAENLGQAIPLFYHLANGGEYDPWGLGNRIDFGPEMPGRGGILNPDLRLDEVAAQVAMVRQALSGIMEEGTLESLNLVGSGAGGASSPAQPPAVVIQDNSVNTNAPNVSSSSAVTVGSGGRKERRELEDTSRPSGAQ